MRRKLFSIVASTALLLSAGSALAQANGESLTSRIIGKDGKQIGAVTVTEAPTGVLGKVVIKEGGLAPGSHAMHFHDTADCSDVGTFKKSGSHINPDKRKHGLLNPEGPDNADLPNIFIHADGSGATAFFNARLSVRSEAEGRPKLLDDNGSALIIHVNPDDYLSQPIGGAGDRVACAAIKPTR